MSSTTTADFAHAPPTIRLGDLEVPRLGFGAMRLPGAEVWGEPDDPAVARAVVRRAVELGVRLIDTSWYYGPLVANRLIAEALHPYPKDLVIATKLGGKRLPDKSWAPATSPAELRAGMEEDLRTLRIERADVVHFRFIPSAVPFLESFDALVAMQKEGKLRHLALSNVSAAQIETARERAPIVSVQNLFNVAGSKSPFPMGGPEKERPEAALLVCEKHGIAFMPFFPLAIGGVTGNPALTVAAKKHGVSEAQIAIAWLLARSPVMLPIPGTSSLAHLEENWAARTIALAKDEVTEIERAAIAAWA
jgi:aryl-alcohol dehydrogenase-like predicted oxidoreductase